MNQQDSTPPWLRTAFASAASASAAAAGSERGFSHQMTQGSLTVSKGGVIMGLPEL
jgi:hypothetical protein